ncbi:hypothetical protein Pan153_47050 [Gimesia panareensis]|uniref:Transposase n=1 Tax=Gimesia panareensis TaxID=2527978 RepID=A0A518FUL2_9PLAN|nr:hypothetical protein Pan153_47050 [Gimesia panareensis]
MPTKCLSSEQIISKLREAEAHLAQGMTFPLMCKKLGILQQNYYKWRREYGGLRMDQAKRLKELEKNARFKKTLAESELDKAILREAAS